MKSFFDDRIPGNTVSYHEATFDLPILYFRDDAFGLYFTAAYDKVRAIMPSDKLYPVILPNKRAIVAVFAFNYINTSIGAYGEVAVALAAVYGKKTNVLSGMLPAMLESRYPGFGVLVMHLPVTGVEARDAGRGEWGYTKFIADMHFNITPEFLECSMSERDGHILDLRVRRKGIYLRDKKPLTTYSVKSGNLLKTVIPQTASKRISLWTGGSYLKLGDHPVAMSVRDLDISPSPFMSVYYPERAAILPSGTVIETGVRSLDGYFGENRKAEHRIEYPLSFRRQSRFRGCARYGKRTARSGHR